MKMGLDGEDIDFAGKIMGANAYGEVDWNEVKTADYSHIHKYIQTYVDEGGFCITLTKTEFIYTDGQEPGVILGMINYPRFPSDEYTILQKSFVVARGLIKLLNQKRCSIVTSKKTYLVENDEMKS